MTTDCRTCLYPLVQLPTGSWVTLDGRAYCRDIGDKELHEPIIPPEWAERIKALHSHSPTFWTPCELAKLMQLPESRIKEVLANDGLSSSQ